MCKATWAQSDNYHLDAQRNVDLIAASESEKCMGFVVRLA